MDYSIKMAQGKIQTHNNFVDDNLMAKIRKWMPQAMAANIEALFRLLGRPEIKFRKSALYLEKCLKTICSYKKIQLGKLINIRTMNVSMTNERIQKRLLN